MEYLLPVASTSTRAPVDLFTSTGSNSSVDVMKNLAKETSDKTNDNIQPTNTISEKPNPSYNKKCLKKMLKSAIEPKEIFEIILETIHPDHTKEIMNKLEVIIRSEMRPPEPKPPAKSGTKRKATAKETIEEKPTKKKKENPISIKTKNPELFDEWKTKLEEAAKMDLPSFDELEKMDELPESQKHIVINYNFLTQKKNNRSEQVRLTQRKFFEKYPKLFYVYSYFSLNGKVKVIKEVLTHHPKFLHGITNIPEKYKNFWKDEISAEDD